MRAEVRGWFTSVWEWYCRLSGLGLISLAVAYGVVSLFSPDGSVWEATNVRLHTPEIHVGDRLSYSMDLKANESCPGEVVSVMTSMTNHGPPATVTFRRRVIRPGVDQKDMTGFIELPESVTPGNWLFTSGVESRCTKRVKFDELTRFRVKVLPK